jgi:hypothetical protein
MIDEYVPDTMDVAAILADVPHIARLLQGIATEGRDTSYSEFLLMLGLRFSRPKMRALCKTLDEVDRRANAAGQPELAVLVVRESDRLPGQGWWTGRRDYQGAWTGSEARAFLNSIQAETFAHWRARTSKRKPA